MLLARIQQDLFDFADQDPDEFPGLVEYWYRQNSEVLSAALTAEPGLTLLVNVSSFNSFETYAKKLFLIADTLVIRDTREWTESESGFHTIPIPTDEYKPGYIDEVHDELIKLRPSPLTLLYRPTLYMTSTHKTLKSGRQIVYAGWDYNAIPRAFLDWIGGTGRSYMQTGRIVYAPFIPSMKMELEFLNNGVNLPEHFGATPCFHQKYDWLSENSTKALFSLKFPFLDGIDVETISKIKNDYRDEFSGFSRTMLASVEGVKAAFGTEGFVNEIRKIQRDQIDAALSDIGKTVTKIKSMRSLREGAILVGLLGLNGLAYLGGPAGPIVSGLTAAGAAMIAERVAQLRDENALRENKGYFLWRLSRAKK